MIGQLSTTQTLQLIRYRKPLQCQDVIPKLSVTLTINEINYASLALAFCIFKQYTALSKSNCHMTDTRRQVTVMSVDGDAKQTAGNRK